MEASAHMIADAIDFVIQITPGATARGTGGRLISSIVEVTGVRDGSVTRSELMRVGPEAGVGQSSERPPARGPRRLRVRRTRCGSPAPRSCTPDDATLLGVALGLCLGSACWWCTRRSEDARPADGATAAAGAGSDRPPDHRGRPRCRGAGLATGWPVLASPVRRRLADPQMVTRRQANGSTCSVPSA